jgi:hypothetical protein
MLPVGLAILFLCLILFSTTYLIQQKYYNDELNMRLDGTYELFNKLLAVETDVLESLAGTYVDKKTLQEAFLSGNRETLLRITRPTFEKIRQRFNITHFYFHLPDKTCFLRVHSPGKYGDLINRHTINLAARNIAPAAGLELGPLGTLTLRYVIPWQVDGKLIGFIELGKEIDHVTGELKKILDLEINFLVEKKYLDRVEWQRGRRIMGKAAGDWDLFPNHVLLSTTMSELPVDLGRVLANPAKFNSREAFNLSCADCSYRGVVIPLSKAGVRNIGSIIVLKDNNKISSSKNLIILFAALTLITITISMLLFYSYLGRIESDLVDTYHNLQNSISKHKKTERELAEHQKQLSELIEDRTAELQKSEAKVKVLSGFLPICAACKNIRTADGEWEQIESYIRDRSEAQFSHSYCPDCARKLYAEFRKK